MCVAGGEFARGPRRPARRRSPRRITTEVGRPGECVSLCAMCAGLFAVELIRGGRGMPVIDFLLIGWTFFEWLKVFRESGFMLGFVFW